MSTQAICTNQTRGRVAKTTESSQDFFFPFREEYAFINNLNIEPKKKKIGEFTFFFFSSLIIQLLYDYTVEVRDRFKGLDLIDRVPDELWNEVHDIVQETGIKTIPIEKKCKKAKWLPGRPYK